MRFRKTLRITNGIFWLWLWLSAALMPVTAVSDNFWAAKAVQLFSLNPNIQDIPMFIGNAVFPFILWFVFDRLLRPKAKVKLETATERTDG